MIHLVTSWHSSHESCKQFRWRGSLQPECQWCTPILSMPTSQLPWTREHFLSQRDTGHRSQHPEKSLWMKETSVKECVNQVRVTYEPVHSGSPTAASSDEEMPQLHRLKSLARCVIKEWCLWRLILVSCRTRVGYWSDDICQSVRGRTKRSAFDSHTFFHSIKLRVKLLNRLWEAFVYWQLHEDEGSSIKFEAMKAAMSAGSQSITIDHVRGNGRSRIGVCQKLGNTVRSKNWRWDSVSQPGILPP